MKEYIKINQLAYDALYQEYNRRATEKSAYEENPETLGGKVLEHANLHFDQKAALEVGPGSGEMLSYFEQNGCRTIAIELSTKIVQIAKERSPNTIFILDNVLNVEFAENQFEVIYAGALIHLFPLDDAIELLRMFYKWIKPNGVTFVNTTIHTSCEEGYYTKYDYGVNVKRFRRKWTEEELIGVLKEVGFEIFNRLFTDETDREKRWVAFLCTKKG